MYCTLQLLAGRDPTSNAHVVCCISFGIKSSGSRVAQIPQRLEISLDAVEYKETKQYRIRTSQNTCLCINMFDFCDAASHQASGVDISNSYEQRPFSCTDTSSFFTPQNT